uniref:ERF family protein n=1 Tax=Streptococcus pluranimalium TaxID=82348 RepID=UPI003F68DD91
MENKATSTTTVIDEKALDVYDVLSRIQSELFVEKGDFNNFGGFNYRTLEDIFSAVKPLLAKYGAALYFKEQLETFGQRIYVNSTVHLRYKGEEVVGTGSAREEEMPKPKMSAEQTTSSAVTFARKTAISGLFLISESSSDPDTQENNYNGYYNQATTTNYQNQPSQPQPAPKAPQPNENTQETPHKRTVNEVFNSGLEAAEQAGATPEQLDAWMQTDDKRSAVAEMRIFVAQAIRDQAQQNSN